MMELYFLENQYVLSFKKLENRLSLKSQKVASFHSFSSHLFFL